MEELLKRISIDPKVMMGKPVIAGTRITVEHIMRLLAAGQTTADILDAHAHISPDDVRAACAYAATRVGEDRVLIVAE